MIYKVTRFHVPIWNNSLVSNFKYRDKNKFRTVAMFLLLCSIKITLTKVENIIKNLKHINFR
jgi:hypothetical protein